MNTLVYFHDEVTIDEAIGQDGSDSETVPLPEKVPYVVRTTMEELGYRTAVWYDPKGEPLMHYQMTLKGIQPRKIHHEDHQRNDNVERLPLSGKEPRLLG